MISLKWFKEVFRTEKEKELEQLNIENAKLQNKILESKIQENKETDRLVKYVQSKPFLNIKMTNNVLTIVLRDGTVLLKPGATKEDFEKARNSTTEEQLFQVAVPEEEIYKRKQEEAEEKRLKHILDGISSLPAEHFLFKEDSVYMKDEKGNVINRSIPQLLVEKFANLTGDVSFDKNNIEYQALRKFWLKCCLNPNAKSAEDLYTFLSNHKFKIDKHGNFYAYRRVVSKNDKENKKLVDFISNSYTKIKAVWKKKPANYYVWQEDDGSFIFNTDSKPDGIAKLYGNLQDLYLNLPNMQKEAYTSAHTGAEDYKVGEVISMPRFEGDDNNSISCSKGFHAASKAYDYSGFGDTPILVIINPIDVLAVPLNEVGKLRTCRWFFAMTLTREEQYILDDDDFDVTELGDVFEEKCLIDLQNYVQNSYAEEVKRHTFIVPTISAKEISSIVHSLEDMKKAISERVKVVLD